LVIDPNLAAQASLAAASAQDVPLQWAGVVDGSRSARHICVDQSREQSKPRAPLDRMGCVSSQADAVPQDRDAERQAAFSRVYPAENLIIAIVPIHTAYCLRSTKTAQ